ncbi:MAG: toxin-antitoxin system YwqK family antitoxin [Flavobacteriaceae bacterium]|nr:toxin-antitoxin system YwqK family antitoxin [Bacteroidia bacterium]NNK82168.1 toxin-antitoxin system YwqK family antitoxin [Flavobacteriaceae bacterium]
MRPIILLVTLFFTFFSFAQEINQFDENGKRHGVWQKTFDKTDNLRYQGQFEHGKEVGLFKYYKLVGTVSRLAATKQFNKENNITETKFFASNGRLISEGIMDGKIYIGEWKYYHKDGKTLMTIENFNNQGILHGKKQVFYKNGQIAEDFTYNLGRLDGEALYYADNGTLIKKYLYINDILHGFAQHFDAQGNKLVEGDYKKGKKHGVWKYYENGKLVRTKDFTVYSKNPYKKKKK